MKLVISNTSSAVLVALLTLFVLFFLYLMVEVNHIETGDSNSESQSLSSCIEKYKSPTSQVNELYSLSTFCFGKIASQFKLDEEKIKRDSYVFQRNENVILLYMVVLVTLSGVALAGLQLLASYSLAAGGRGKLAEGGELKYSTQGISFRSSVVGLMILAMSFAFFLVFIVYVYTFQPEQPDRAPAGSSRVNLFPALPDAKKIQPTPSPSASPQPTPTP
jgi:hypothetical protein